MKSQFFNTQRLKKFIHRRPCGTYCGKDINVKEIPETLKQPQKSWLIALKDAVFKAINSAHLVSREDIAVEDYQVQSQTIQESLKHYQKFVEDDKKQPDEEFY